MRVSLAALASRCCGGNTTAGTAESWCATSAAVSGSHWLQLAVLGLTLMTTAVHPLGSRECVSQELAAPPLQLAARLHLDLRAMLLQVRVLLRSASATAASTACALPLTMRSGEPLRGSARELLPWHRRRGASRQRQQLRGRLPAALLLRWAALLLWWVELEQAQVWVSALLRGRFHLPLHRRKLLGQLSLQGEVLEREEEAAVQRHQRRVAPLQLALRRVTSVKCWVRHAIGWWSVVLGCRTWRSARPAWRTAPPHSQMQPPPSRSRQKAAAASPAGLACELICGITKLVRLVS